MSSKIFVFMISYVYITQAICYLIMHTMHVTIVILKSSVIWFSVRSRNNGAQPQILIDNVPLSQVTKQKYLGVTFDNKLSWSSHVAATWQGYGLLFISN